MLGNMCKPACVDGVCTVLLKVPLKKGEGPSAGALWFPTFSACWDCPLGQGWSHTAVVSAPLLRCSLVRAAHDMSRIMQLTAAPWKNNDPH